MLLARSLWEPERRDPVPTQTLAAALGLSRTTHSAPGLKSCGIPTRPVIPDSWGQATGPRTSRSICPALDLRAVETSRDRGTLGLPVSFPERLRRPVCGGRWPWGWLSNGLPRAAGESELWRPGTRGGQGPCGRQAVGAAVSLVAEARGPGTASASPQGLPTSLVLCSAVPVRGGLRICGVPSLGPGLPQGALAACLPDSESLTQGGSSPRTACKSWVIVSFWHIRDPGRRSCACIPRPRPGFQAWKALALQMFADRE